MNQRRWPRINVALSVEIRFQNRDELTAARTLNISRSGLFIGLAQPRPIGTPVRVRICIGSTGESFLVEGIVVHRQSADEQPLAPGIVAGMGVFLTHASPEYEELCDELAAGAARAKGASRARVR